MFVFADTLSVVGVILGVVAIVVGLVGIGIALMLGGDQIEKMQTTHNEQIETIKQVHEEQLAAAAQAGQSQLDSLEHVHTQLDSTLRELRGDVATHYIGRFPDFIEDIVQVIKGATKQLTIFCDLPAYGLVSNPEWFEKYTEAIQDRACDDRVDVRMVHLDKPGRRAGLDRQFDKRWATLRKAPNVELFIASKGLDIAALNRAAFFNLIEQAQVDALEAFKDTARTNEMKPVETNAIMPMYFWIADGKRAVFALTQWERKAHEVGFWTRSENLIRAMQGIYARYAAEAGKPSAKRQMGSRSH